LIETGVRFIVTDELRAAKVFQAARGLDIPVFVIGQAENCIPFAQLLECGEIEQSYLINAIKKTESRHFPLC
jgi:hypothetical protein